MTRHENLFYIINNNMLKIHQNFVPNFICVGQRKCATSWIWKQLLSHPDICTYNEKEINFFDKFYNLGIGWYQSHFQCRYNKVSIDVTPDYFNKSCAEKIKIYYPDMKIIVCLRNPTERSFSQWKFSKFIEYNKSENFFSDWQNDFNGMKTRGLYDDHLLSFLNLFDSKNILVLIYDDLEKSPQEFFKSICKFMKIKYYDEKVSQHRWMPGVDMFWEKICKNSKEYSQRYDVYKNYNLKYKMTHDEIIHIDNYYKPSIQNLSKILNRNLESWYQRK